MVGEPVIIGRATLYLGDCREIFPSFALEPRDVVITDPPYGIGWKPRVTHQEQPWHDQIDFRIQDFIRGSHNLVWGGNYFTDSLPVSQGWLTWIKRPLVGNFDNDTRSYATTELAWRDWGKTAFFAHVWDGGMRAGDDQNRSFCHPSQKPVELMAWCLRMLPIGIWRVNDPFMGSGTTGVAAVKMGHSFVGIEREPAYFEIACKRIEDAQRQADLFIGEAA
jgi:site-specific DNA-methyltransferase (adenine-specific)/modification methylase